MALVAAVGDLGWDAVEEDDTTTRRRELRARGRAVFVYALLLVGRGLPFWLGTALFVTAFVFVFQFAPERKASDAAHGRGALVALACGVVTSGVVSHRLRAAVLRAPAVSAPSRTDSCSTDSSRSATRSGAFAIRCRSGSFCCRRSSASIIGALPGLTATMGVALMTTLTIKMPSNQALLVLDLHLRRRHLRRLALGDSAQHPGHAGLRRKLPRRLCAREAGPRGARDGHRHVGLGAGHADRHVLPRAVHAGPRQPRAQVRRLRVLLARALRRDRRRHADRRRSAQGLDRGAHRHLHRGDRPGADLRATIAPRLRRARAGSPAAPTRSSSSTSRGPGWVEHDAAEIWEVDAARSPREALADAGVDGARARRRSGSPTSARPSSPGTRATGEPLHRAIVWQDRRTAERCDELRAAGPRAAGPRAHRPRPRPLLLRHEDRVAAAQRRRRASAPSGARVRHDRLVARLQAHRPRTSPTTRTPRGRCCSTSAGCAWDEELCDAARRRPARAAGAAALRAASSATTARVRRRGARSPASPATSRRRCSARPASTPGIGKNTYGTGSFVLLNTGAERAARRATGLLTTVAWRIGERADLRARGARSSSPAPPCSGCATGSGSSSAAAETEALAASLDGNDGVYFVPALTGLGSPHWDPYARGTIVGLTRGSGRAHLARAALEAIAYQTVDAVRAQEAAAGRAARASCKADGGAVANALADAVPGRRARRAGGRARGRRDDGARRRLPGRDRDRRAGRSSEVAAMWREAARYEPRDGRGRARGAARRTGAGRSSGRGAGPSRRSRPA